MHTSHRTWQIIGLKPHAHLGFVRQVLSNYMVLVSVVVSLPISFLPWAQRASSHTPRHLVAPSQWLSSYANQAQNIYRLVLGGPASTDCLLQSWGLWTECDVLAAATSVIMRALIRSVQVVAVNSLCTGFHKPYHPSYDLCTRHNKGITWDPF